MPAEKRVFTTNPHQNGELFNIQIHDHQETGVQKISKNHGHINPGFINPWAVVHWGRGAHFRSNPPGAGLKRTAHGVMGRIGAPFGILQRHESSSVGPTESMGPIWSQDMALG